MRQQRRWDWRRWWTSLCWYECYVSIRVMNCEKNVKGLRLCPLSRVTDEWRWIDAVTITTQTISLIVISNVGKPDLPAHICTLMILIRCRCREGSEVLSICEGMGCRHDCCMTSCKCFQEDQKIKMSQWNSTSDVSHLCNNVCSVYVRKHIW